ncbi:MAG: DNA helicase RecG [Persephonella sp.]|nr:MAG: DNA helicase RecG [Persephonella sp.]
MGSIKKAKEIIQKVLKYDNNLLERTKGLSIVLVELLKDFIPKGIIDDIKSLDSLNVNKKRAFLDYLLKVINEVEKKKNYSDEKKNNQDLGKTLDRKAFKNFLVKDLKILKPIEKRALKRVNIIDIEDVFFFPPKRYEDKRLKKLAKVKDGEQGLFKVKVEGIKEINKGKLKTVVILKQGNLKLKAFFVHNKPFLYTFFRKGKEVYIYGKINKYGKDLSIIQPEIYKDLDSIVLDRIVPVYSLRGDTSVKLSSQTINHLRRAIYKILKGYLKYYPDYIPTEILSKYNYPSIKLAIKNLHFPDESLDIDELNMFETIYQERLIFDELFILELAQGYRKNLIKQEPAERINIKENFIEEVEKHLSFRLTEDQKKALKDIFNDLSQTKPMNRLIQGDVGSGKTVVAIISALAVALDGKQVAVMAPTEILANQHFMNFQKITSKFGIDSYLLTGSMSKKDKKKIYSMMESGEAKIVIGTHALIQDEVRFKNLSLVIVDEQHRFGVIQRKALIEKSHKIPHTLIMTATPIPRTLQIANFGDLDVSIIKQMPKGRKPVETLIFFSDERKKIESIVREELEKGRQAYIVYPLIEKSESLDLKSAEEGYKKWKEAFPDKNVALLHGKMSQEEKDKIMEAFRRGIYHILVSTTVIEVGVDVPNATVMVIEDAYRFGLSQIHQLRGRVGRGQYEGKCLLVIPDRYKNPKTPEEKNVLDRLKILVRVRDGFRIAEEDLRLRGGGDIVGTAQSGRINLGIADLNRPLDRLVLEKAKEEADRLLEKDPFLDKHPKLKELVFEKYGNKFELVNVG